jgi:hypothetical protein
MALDQFTYTQLEQYFKGKYLGYDYRDLRNTILTLQEIFGRDMTSLRAFLDSASITIEKSEELVKAARDYADQALGVANSVQTQFDAVVERATDSDAMSRQAAIDADGVDHLNLKARADNDYLKTKERLDNSATIEEYEVSPSVISAFWDSPDVPSIRPQDEIHFADVTWKYDEMINNLWEPLRAKEPGYINRINKGKDASGYYDWWRYEFTPPNYEKTIILGGGIHGPERINVYTLYYFMNLVVNEWRSYPQLSYMRHKVRIIVIPSQNPWGLSNLKRQNFNGVDLNRNFDVNWSTYPMGQPWDHDYKGTAPFSEIESQYIKETLEAYTDAIAYLDLHNFGSPAQDFILYTPKKQSTDREIYRNLIDYLATNQTTEFWGEHDYPSAFNYASSRFGMHSSNPEFPLGNYGETHGAEDMTRALRWFGNIFLQHAKLESNAKVKAGTEPFVIRTIFNRTTGQEVVVSPDGNYKEIEDFQLSFDVPTSGMVMLEGEITIVGTENPTTQIFFTPKLGQKGTDFLPETIQVNNWEVYTEGPKRQTISFNAEIPVIPSNNTDGNKVVMGLYAKRTTDGTGEIRVYRYRSRVTFIPVDRANKFSLYSASNRQGTGIGAMQKFYP